MKWVLSYEDQANQLRIILLKVMVVEDINLTL